MNMADVSMVIIPVFRKWVFVTIELFVEWNVENKCGMIFFSTNFSKLIPLQFQKVRNSTR